MPAMKRIVHIRKRAHIYYISTTFMVSHERVGSALSQAMSMLNLKLDFTGIPSICRYQISVNVGVD